MKNDMIVKKAITYSDKIMTYCQNIDYDTFMKDTMLVEACVFNLSQIGELVKHLDDDFVNSHSEIPWAQLRGLRNRIVHDYEGVNLTLVWEIIFYDIPTLNKQLRNIEM